MADGLNRWMGIGNLCADPELRITQSGEAVLKLRLACNESYLDKSGSRQERCEYLNITLFGKRGEALSKFLTKGERLFVEGRIQTSSYEKDGEKRYRTEVIATNVILSGGGKRNGGSAPADEGGAEPDPWEQPQATGTGGRKF
jgi:single-strand DNA-binding protein